MAKKKTLAEGWSISEDCLRPIGKHLISLSSQGQRPLSRFATENIEEEVIVPTATSPLHGDALLAGMLLEE